VQASNGILHLPFIGFRCNLVGELCSLHLQKDRHKKAHADFPAWFLAFRI
jgi:hypothetical protein